MSWLEKLPITLISGLILGLSSASWGVWWLAWVAMAPLIVLVFGSKSRTEAALTGLLFGLAYHMASLKWLFEVYPLRWFGLSDVVGFFAAVQLWFIESLHQASLFCLFAWLIAALPMRAGFMPYYSRPFFPMMLSVPLIWMFFQWVVAPTQWFLGIPVDQLAYSQARVPEMIQIARYGGAVAVDTLIVLANCAVAALIMEFTGIAGPLESRSDPLSTRTGTVFDFVFVCLLVGLNYSFGESQIARAAVMPEYWTLDAIPAQDEKNETKQLGEQSLGPTSTSSANIPSQATTTSTTTSSETSTSTTTSTPTGTAHGSPSDNKKSKVPVLTEQQKSAFAPAVPIAVVQPNLAIENKASTNSTDVAERYLNLAQNLGVSILVLPEAALAPNVAEPLRGKLERLAANERKEIVVGSVEKSADERLNAVRLISIGPGSNRVYAKRRLVPFSEYIPLGPIGSIVPAFLKEKLNGEGTFSPGSKTMLLDSIFGKIGASVSAEVVYPGLIADEVSRGASLLINVSDVSYFHGSTAGQALLSAAIIRAVENGRYLILASNTGISAVIDPSGIVTSLTVPSQKGILIDRVQFLHEKTPFTRMWWLWTPFLK